MNISNKIWKELAGTKRPEEGFVRRRIKLLSKLDVFLALSLPENRPSILFEVSNEYLPLPDLYPSCCGFKMSVSQCSVGRALAILEITDLSYNDVFAVLADDVLYRLDTAGNEKDGCKIFLSTLQRWQYFFQHQMGDGLSEMEQQGTIWRTLVNKGNLNACYLAY